MATTRDSLGLVLRAADFAAREHREQRRKDAEATPYINHPIRLAAILYEEGGVRDATVLAAALLHDTMEDTGTTYDELRGEFGAAVVDVVAEVTDAKFLRDVLAHPPANWSLQRRQEYFDWAQEVVNQVRGVNPKLERAFDRLYRQRPQSPGDGK